MKQVLFVFISLTILCGFAAADKPKQDDVAASVRSVENQMKELSNKLRALESTVSNNAASTNGPSEAVTKLNQRVSQLEQSFAETNNLLKAIQDRLAQHEAHPHQQASGEGFGQWIQEKITCTQNWIKPKAEALFESSKVYGGAAYDSTSQFYHAHVAAHVGRLPELCQHATTAVNNFESQVQEQVRGVPALADQARLISTVVTVSIGLLIGLVSLWVLLQVLKVVSYVLCCKCLGSKKGGKNNNNKNKNKGAATNGQHQDNHEQSSQSQKKKH